MIPCECNGCTKRHAGCHATCKSYKLYREQVDTARREKAKEYPYYSMSHDQEMKYRKNLRQHVNRK